MKSLSRRIPAWMAQEGSKEWWQAKYEASPGFVYGKEPSRFLTEHIDLLRKSETLDVAMGEGRNSVLLALKGFDVAGVDFINLAIERATKLAAESGAKMTAKIQDLDFYLVPLMKYDTILVTDFHPPLTLFKGLARGLKPGGTILLEGYTVEQLRLTGGYRPEPFECFRPNEALEYIRELHLVVYNERQLTPTESRVQLVARKPLHR